jgi:hypothetical protein
MRFVLALYHMVHFGIFSLNSSSTVKLIGRRGRDCMVVAFTTIYAISAYHLWCCELESRSGWGVQHYVIYIKTEINISIKDKEKIRNVKILQIQFDSIFVCLFDGVYRHFTIYIFISDNIC